MALSYNKFMGIGNLTADPELKQSTSGISVCRFCMAIHREGTKGDGSKTDFLQVVAWRHNAEYITRYGRKGDNVLVEGSIQNNKWIDKQGNNRTECIVVAEHVSINRGKKEAEQENQSAAVEYEEIPNNDGLPF